MKHDTTTCTKIKKLLTDNGWKHAENDHNLDGFQVERETNQGKVTACVMDIALCSDEKEPTLEGVLRIVEMRQRELRNGE